MTPGAPTMNEFISLPHEPETGLDVPNPNLTPRKQHAKWEKKFPFVYASLDPTPDSLAISVEIQATDTGQRVGITALLDCGANGLFINSKFVRKRGARYSTLVTAGPKKAKFSPWTKKWHNAIFGQGGTTLNSIIGEDKMIAVKLG